MRQFRKNFLFTIENPETGDSIGMPSLKFDANIKGEQMTLQELYEHYVALCMIAEDAVKQLIGDLRVGNEAIVTNYPPERLGKWLRRNDTKINFDNADFEHFNPHEVHSEWAINSDGYYPYCKRCKRTPPNRVMTKYCPECGARMDGKENEN